MHDDRNQRRSVRRNVKIGWLKLRRQMLRIDRNIVPSAQQSRSSALDLLDQRLDLITLDEEQVPR